MKYTVTWSEHATYKTEVTVTNADIAAWANETGILRSLEHAQDPSHKISADDITKMQGATPAFHRAIIALYTNKTTLLRPSDSSIVTATGQRISEITSGR
ncbi:hypothetical protein [Arthrobacter glacialis]|uniref:Uncharacterized protein n=1 Tax=Arthrobacter glacialis TaxID=1664 RepID=A0A2S3ZTB6_ARTGL|nr:hypothetical protein [Arthrobacter glacialis]POH72506.1 hypothetical protein CVS27_15410 [Arthrobacter glacialis]